MRHPGDTSDNTPVYFGDSPYRTWPLLALDTDVACLFMKRATITAAPLPFFIAVAPAIASLSIIPPGVSRPVTFTSPCVGVSSNTFRLCRTVYVAVIGLMSSGHDTIPINDRTDENTSHREDWIRVTARSGNVPNAKRILSRISIWT